MADVETLAASIISDGSEVTLLFDQQDATNVSFAFFVMNGFELDNGSETLMVDFSADPNLVLGGWEGYLASGEVAETFTAQSFSAFGDTITLEPAWGLEEAGMINATLTKTSTDPLNPTAELDTNIAGEYTVQLTVTDLGGQSSSDTMIVNVEATACDAAIAAGIPFNTYDVTGPEGASDCVVNLLDFADFAMVWMDDVSLTEQQ